MRRLVRSSAPLRLAAALVLALLASVARAEVWPTTGRALTLGSEAWVRGGALGLIENPALLGEPEDWSVGVGWLVPFGVSEFTRVDAAVSAALGRGGVGAAWSQLGRRGWGARRLSAGGAARLAEDRLAFGAGVHGTSRGERRAWSADLGLLARVRREWRLGLAARSVWRAGDREVAPESEWAASIVWSPEPLALGYSLLRDAIGPIENRWSARLTLGILDTHVAYADRVGEEWRVVLGVSLRTALAKLALGQESGRVLPETRGGALVLEPAAAGTPAKARTVTPHEIAWGFDAGLVGRGERGLGARAGVEWSKPRTRSPGFLVAAAASRDPGEPSGFDEGRAHARLSVARLGAWHGGSMDLHVGRGLVVSRNGGHGTAGARTLFAVENAARLRRSPVPAPAGVAVSLGERGRSRWLAAWVRMNRDARPLAGGLWPSGGRLHRSETERARRGALAEQLSVLAYTIRPAAAWSAGLAVAAVRHAERGPRLLPGGGVRTRDRWVTTMGEWQRRTDRLSWEAALDAAGRCAVSLHGRFATTPRRARLRLEFLLERAPPGYAPATAWPSLARFTNLLARAELAPLRSPWAIVLARRVEERWVAPTATLPPRRQWVVQSSMSVTRRLWSGSLGFETGVREEQRSEVEPTANGLLWRATRRGWWEGSWIWHASRSASVQLRPSWRLYADGWRETWRLVVSGRGAVRWEVEAVVRPGGTVSEDENAAVDDPLGGVQLDPSTSPARLRVRAAHGPAEAEFRWSETTAGPRPELWLRVRGAASLGLW